MKIYEVSGSNFYARRAPLSYGVQLGVRHSLKAECPNVTLHSIGHQAQSEGQSVLPPLTAVRAHLTVAIRLGLWLLSKGLAGI